MACICSHLPVSRSEDPSTTMDMQVDSLRINARFWPDQPALDITTLLPRRNEDILCMCYLDRSRKRVLSFASHTAVFYWTDLQQFHLSEAEQTKVEKFEVARRDLLTSHQCGLISSNFRRRSFRDAVSASIASVVKGVRSRVKSETGAMVDAKCMRSEVNVILHSKYGSHNSKESWTSPNIQTDPDMDM